MTPPSTFVTMEELRLAHARCTWIAREKPDIEYSSYRETEARWSVRVGTMLTYAPTFQGAIDRSMEVIP